MQFNEATVAAENEHAPAARSQYQSNGLVAQEETGRYIEHDDITRFTNANFIAARSSRCLNELTPAPSRPHLYDNSANAARCLSAFDLQWMPIGRMIFEIEKLH